MKYCPVCRETCEPRLVEIYQEYRLFHCPLCNVVFSDPMQNPGGEYYQAYEGSELRKVFPESISWSHREFLLDLPAREGRLLDVGCGTGYFLSIVRQLGYEVTGIDFDKDAIDTGRRRYGLENIYPLSIEDAHRALQRRYDVVTFFEVLEHVDDPPRFLDHINALLKPGGYIVLSVPNRETPWWCDPLYRTTDNYPPYHLTRWSLSALEHFLDGHSFKILKARIKPLEAEELHRRWFSFGFMRMVGKSIILLLRGKRNRSV